jgi:hypothetical protein
LAGTVGIFTAWYTFKLQDNAAKAKAETERQSVIAAFQAEIELNLIKLTTRFRRYELAIQQERPLMIASNEFSTTVYEANLPHIGGMQDLALIAEIVSLYNGLASLEDWASSIREGKSAAESTKRTLRVATFKPVVCRSLPSGTNGESVFKCAARIANPQFDDNKTKLLETIKILRHTLGAKPPQTALRFHPAPDDEIKEKGIQ